MSIKVKVNLPNELYRILLEDMTSFDFVKNNGTINKNGFINLLLRNFFEEFSAYEGKIINHLSGLLATRPNTSQMKTIQYDLMDAVYSLHSLTENNDNYEVSLQFVINKENENLFSTIESHYLQERTVSKYFRDMITNYCARSQYKREAIIFKHIYTAINKAIELKRKVIIMTTFNRSIIVDPYLLTRTKEELYNYFLGVENTGKNGKGKRTIISYKLFKIVNVIMVDEESLITANENELLKKTTLLGAQFPLNRECLTVLELTDKGIRLYKDIYLNRPTPIKVEGNIYTFDCDYNQIEFYFFKFGKEVKIIKPHFLQRTFINMYYQSINRYKKQKND